MNGFLVIGRCAIDEVPLRLCATRLEAEQFAGTVNEGDIASEACDVNGVDASIFVAVAILEFRDGAPMKMQNFKTFGDEDTP